MIVYFVRHGESEGNKSGLHQGPESPLSKFGVKQAKIVAKRLSKHKIDAIYASPFTRAKQTAELISKKKKLPIEFWENLQEIKYPSEIFGKSASNKKVREIRRQVHEHFLTGEGRYSDEETYEELSKRAEGVLKHLVTHHSKQNVVCVSHSTMIKTIVSKAVFGEKLAPEIFIKLREHSYINNTGITVLKYTKKYGWTLFNWNDITHL